MPRSGEPWGVELTKGPAMTTTATTLAPATALIAETPGLRLRVTSHPMGRTVLLGGEFGVETADLVAVVVGHVLRSGQDVVLDLADVTFCDVRACNALFVCARDARAAGTTLRLVNVRAFQRRVFRLVGLDAVVGVTRPCA